MEDDFKTYQQQILNNAKTMSKRFMDNDVDIVSNGTSNHMFLVNLIKNNVTGKDLEAALELPLDLYLLHCSLSS